jgi:hypothetical protein
MRSIAIPALLIAVCGCGPAVERQASANAENAVTNVDSAATATEARAEGVVPGEPEAIQAPVDPKGLQAAKQLVETYADLLVKGRFGAAHDYWAGDSLSDAQFADKWRAYGRFKGAAVDDPGLPEGAAGSIYVDVPLQLFGTTRTGHDFSLSGKLTLRRVNDVPGSTEEQRRWHIHSSELAPVD